LEGRVILSLFLVMDDKGRMVPDHEIVVQQGPAYPSVAVGKGVDIFEPGMEICGGHQHVLAVVGSCFCYQLRQFPFHILCGRSHLMDAGYIIVLLELARSFLVFYIPAFVVGTGG
jgi:hypothetical protein